MERYRQAEKKSGESAQQETDAPTKAAYKMAIKAFWTTGDSWIVLRRPPSNQDAQSRVGPGKGASDESVPLSKRIRAGQNQIAMHERDLKAANERRAEHCGCSEELGTAPRKGRRHREGAAGATEPSGAAAQTSRSRSVTRRRLRTASRKLQTSTRQSARAEAAAKEAAARPANEAMELDEFGGLVDQEDPALDPTALVRIQASIDELLQAQTRGDPERLAVLAGADGQGRQLTGAKKRDRSKGSTSRRRTTEISIVTINGNFWTTHTEWKAHVGPRHLVLGQEHRLEAGRCDEEAGKLGRQGWRCGFSPAKRSALKAKTHLWLRRAGTLVAAPKHWGLEWVWSARGWQSNELQDQGRAHDGMGSHHGENHSLQCVLLPHWRS